MKLRSLTLGNVRKFAGQTARISGITDGVTVVAQANEFGKSTFFDALHALFFLKYGAATREVKSLQPRAGGAVKISAEIDLPTGRYTLEKSYLAQKRASVRDAEGRVIALDDEAEAWIAKLMGSGQEGPAGLLWVRQGVIALEPAGSTGKEREILLGARRNLLSSVAGEIDMVTGGRRMDRVIEAATKARAVLATTTGQPKANGPWKDAQTEAHTLEERHADLDQACRALGAALADRRAVTARLATLDAAGVQEALDRAVQDAEARFAASQAHADKVAQAQTQAALTLLERDAAQHELDRLVAGAQQLQDAQATARTAQDSQAAAVADLETAEDAVEVAKDAATLARAALDDCIAQKALAQQDALHRNAAETHARLTALAAQIEEKETALEADEQAVSQLHVTPDALNRIEQAHAAHARAQTEAAAASVQLSIDYTGDVRITRAGVALEDGAHAIAERQHWDIPQVGRLTLDPGAAAMDLTRVETAAKAARDALHAVGATNLDAARKGAATRAEASSRVALLRNAIETLAPDGTAVIKSALSKAHAALEALRAAEGKDAPEDMTALEARLDHARDKSAELQQQFEVKRELRDTARARKERATAALDAAHNALEGAAARHGDADSFAGRQATAARVLTTAQVAAQDAQSDVEILRRDAPDLATAQAGLTRARSAADNAREERAALRTKIADLSATIRARAEDGIEEQRDEVAGRLQDAKARAARFAHEVDGLTLLLDALREKRGAAQDAYFGPVQQELAPLLNLLHADAALSFDPSSMLPQGLARDGEEEEMQVLSGGTQEQIAILTRLAFARLFARQGKPMPVILDDALVYSDDSRIMAMFTALHRVAADQQVIVFSCRQMAFAGLGGARPSIEIVDER